MILGVSFDSVERNRAFAEKYDFNYPLLCDTDKRMAVAYGAAADDSAGSASRTGVIIDANGAIAFWSERVSSDKFPDRALAFLS